MAARYFCLFSTIIFTYFSFGQDRMSPELLWKLKRIGSVQVDASGEKALYTQTEYELKENKGYKDVFLMDLKTGESVNLTNSAESEYGAEWSGKENTIRYMKSVDGVMQIFEFNIESKEEKKISSFSENINGYIISGDLIVYAQNVKLDKTVNEIYPDLPLAEARIMDDLMYRHWDSWHDYTYSHVFIAKIENGLIGEGKDIMEGEKFDSPLKPFGGMEQIAISPDGKQVVYTCKKVSGINYAISTNSDLYAYNIESGETKNLTEGRMGYDMNPKFSPNGKYLSWTSMKRDGYEADKNDIILKDQATGNTLNLTKDIDLTVADYVFNEKEDMIYFKSDKHATVQLFEFDLKKNKTRQITDGDHNWTSIALAGKYLVGTKTTMNHPNEIFKVDIKKGEETQLSHANKEIYDKIKTSKIEKRWITTSDNKKMLTWVIYPPDFDPNKKYPTLLYCQGGPQSAVSQFFSFRWNFQLMAANDYIIVAPNRRGLPGFGQEWNEAISKDWGGQAMKDYLAAIDSVSKEPYCDENRMGAIGASYGGYSVYYLAGNHEKRFKTFISHCGLFNLYSWYGTTEELFFANWDIGGPYWLKENAELYQKNSPSNYVQNWDTPMLVIHGEKDFRVPIGEGMQAFQVAQIKGIPSRFLYFPGEGHWVLSPQNGIVWHREFFNWLDRWLK
ncbi:MAG: S9 family peptidase [Crocinitomicaceae bacterium]